MHYVSTRGAVGPTPLAEAVAAGLAPDGGLFVPAQWPRLSAAEFDPAAPLADTAATLLAPFFAGDALAGALPALCRQAFTFDAPLTPLGPEGASVLELFHGPTAAFKDFGARFLAAALSRLRGDDAPQLTVLVATSGDTGAAVAAAFHRVPNLRVVVLYPDGRVSPRQAHQLGCFGDNVQALRVAGSFDDCQRMVKAALADTALQAERPLTSANSISLGRLLPQMSYYAHAALQWFAAHGQPLNLIVPTGNLGNALAAMWVRRLGLPVGEVRLACNANKVLPRFFDGGDYAPAAGVATLANAMDVGAPSNFERLRWMHGDDAAVRAASAAVSVDDATIRATIASLFQAHGYIACPHTATAVHALAQMRERGDRRPWTVVATAHAAKFEGVVEPVIGREVAVPSALAELLARPASAEPLAPSEDALRAQLLADA